MVVYLRKLSKENKSKKLTNVKEVYFFVLNTDTIYKVKDYSGENRIGNIDFEAFTSKEFFSNTDYEDVKYLINRLIVLCFVNFNDEIKQDEDLTKSYEIILEILTELNSEEAAVLLDEFRIH